MEIPGFKITRTIGKGGMATVYLAVQESLGRAVVLKTVDPSKTDKKNFAERFLNEARIIAALRHPHIITIYDIGSADDLIYISMEYVDGGDLKSRISRPLPPAEVLDIIARIGSALHFAHREGVIHRDVKPANILFRRDGTPLLSDFGIAKQVKVDSELTSTGTILGSPFYMSPEQAEGLTLDPRTDIYSLGIICYEMLTGKRPFQSDSAIKVIMQHLQAPMPRLPLELARFQPLMDRMVAKDREQRFADAGALVDYVGRLQREEAAREAGAPQAIIEPGPAGEAAAGGPAAARRRPPGGMRLWLLLGCLLVVAAGIWGVYLYAQSLETPAMVRTQPPPAPEPGAAPAAPATAQAQPGAAAAGGSQHTPAPLRDDVVKALQWLANHSLEEDRLMEPPADNAYYYYSRLLALDPDNAQAHHGFERIAERFVVLAEKEFSRSNYRKAQAYVTLGLQVQPQNKGLHTLQSMIDNRQKSLLDRLIDLVTGTG